MERLTMKDNFYDDPELEDEDEGLEETPDWMALNEEPEGDAEVDEFDMLRQKSARAGSAFDDISEEDPFRDNSSSFSLQGLTSSQRMILAVLLLLNVLVIGTALVLLIL
jgi:hypothetical protein